MQAAKSCKQYLSSPSVDHTLPRTRELRTRSPEEDDRIPAASEPLSPNAAVEEKQKNSALFSGVVDKVIGSPPATGLTAIERLRADSVRIKAEEQAASPETWEEAVAAATAAAEALAASVSQERSPSQHSNTVDNAQAVTPQQPVVTKLSLKKRWWDSPDSHSTSVSQQQTPILHQASKPALEQHQPPTDLANAKDNVSDSRSMVSSIRTILRPNSPVASRWQSAR